MQNSHVSEVESQSSELEVYSSRTGSINLEGRKQLLVKPLWRLGGWTTYEFLSQVTSPRTSDKHHSCLLSTQRRLCRPTNLLFRMMSEWTAFTERQNFPAVLVAMAGSSPKLATV